MTTSLACHRAPPVQDPQRPGPALRHPPGSIDFPAFCAFFRARTGIALPARKQSFVEQQLQPRLAAAAGDFRLYLQRLSQDGEELERLINLLTVNETFFYREAWQIQALTETILPEILAARGRQAKLRLLSLPCASGEEPYSLALQIRNDMPALLDGQAELLGADIDTAALASAQAGLYQQEQLRRLPPFWQAHYFRQQEDGRYLIAPRLRQAVQLLHLNVMDPAALPALAPLDVIFCRNLLIYFDREGRLATLRRFAASLQPGGFLCLGHSESITGLDVGLQPRAIGPGIIYQKPAG